MKLYGIGGLGTDQRVFSRLTLNCELNPLGKRPAVRVSLDGMIAEAQGWRLLKVEVLIGNELMDFIDGMVVDPLNDLLNDHLRIVSML